MQKQEAAIYVPVNASQAQWYFLNRTEAFRKRFDTEGDVLIGYKRYDDAVKAGRSRFASESCFAILSISMSEHVRHGLSMGQLLDGDSLEARTSAPIWRVFSKGAEILANPVNSAMWVQFVESAPVEEKKAGSGTGGGTGSATVKAFIQAAFEPAGTTGFYY